MTHAAITPVPWADTAGTCLNEKQVAARLGISTKTLQKWRRTGEGPIFAKIGGSVRYRQSDVDSFVSASILKAIAQRTSGSASE